MPSILLLLALSVLVMTAALAGESPAPADPPADAHASPQARLAAVHDLDHPWEFRPDFKNRREWERRAKALREQVLVSQGLWPLPERTPLRPVVHGRIDRGEYTVEKVYFQSLPGHYVTGNLYRPKAMKGAKKHPGVLSPHGHWENGRFYENGEAGARKEIETGAEKTMESARYPLQARCAMLARMGAVVFHYDMIGYADSRPIPHREGFRDTQAILRLQSFMGLQTWNSIRALDFLLSLDEVDPDRVAVTGASGGATQTFLLTAVDDRPALAFPAVMVSTAMQGGCVCENSPLLRVGTNNVEIAALFAPQPQGMTGANDWTREIESKGLPEMKAIYGLYGAKDRVDAKYLPFPHNYNQVSRERMYGWVNRHFGLGLDEPVEEKPFEPVPPKDLSVFDAAHPFPADAKDAAAVRAFLTESSDRQMEELRKRPAAYRRTVRRALEVMVHDAMPEKEDAPRFRASRMEDRDGYSYEEGLLTGPGRADVLALRLIPDGWTGDLLLWVHPEGKRSLIGPDGQPVPEARRILERKAAILAPEAFLTGAGADESAWAVRKHLEGPGKPYAGFTFGYNRSLLAERVSDLVTALAAARGMDGVKSVSLLGQGEAGLWALLAGVLAGEGVRRATLDLDGFDFDQIKESTDARMLPGALKYGGVFGFARLLPGKVLLHHAPESAKPQPRMRRGITLRRDALSTEEAMEWLLR
ncbi:MAG: hypothetical protein KY468_11645 [Armatimonadetes bacterium]|nr:hypothetical protein [Armatimonadota bacterium]